MTIRFLLLSLASLTFAALGMSSAVAQSTTRVSVDSFGIGGNDSSEKPSISSDGRFAVFHSDASNLVTGDTNLARDIFLHNAQTGQTIRISVESSGGQANAGSNYPAISLDGRFVVFQSDASNLVPGDTNGTSDVFIHDSQTGQTARISENSFGTQGNDRSDDPSVSGDGRFVAFHSDASNLVPGDTNGIRDVFIHDRQTGQTVLLSVDSLGVQGNGRSDDPVLSANGRFVAFWSEASNLVLNDTNGFADVYVYDRQSGDVRRISVDSSGVQGNQSSIYPSISADGRFVAFHSDASNLVLGDTGGGADSFTHDRLTGQTTIVSVDSLGVHGNERSFDPSISANGRFVAFWSLATNLVQGDTNGDWDVFIHDRQIGTTSRVSVDSIGAQAVGGSSWFPSVSGDGRYIAFQSDAGNLVAGDTGNRDIFVHDRGPTVPSLSKTGSCPGRITLSISGASSNDLIAIIYGPAGSFTKPAPPCAGVTVGIAMPILGALIPADGLGQAVLSLNAPAGVCGLSVQAVDIATCATTNTVVL